MVELAENRSRDAPVFRRMPPSPAYTILMNHQPTGFAIAAARGIGLTISGHVHNGQIWPFNDIVGLFYPYLKVCIPMGARC
jgi:hypothetical protein